MLSLSGKRRKELAGSKPLRRRFPLTSRVWLGLGTAVILSLCLATNLQPQGLTLLVGGTVPEDIHAKANATYVDTGPPLSQASDLSLPRVQTLVEDRKAALDAAYDLAVATQRLVAARKAGGQAAAQTDALRKALPALPDTLLTSLLRSSGERFGAVATTASAALAMEMANRTITTNVGDVDLARTDLLSRARAISSDPGVALDAATFAGAYIRPNVVQGTTSSETQANLDLDETGPVYVVVRKGELLAHKGDKVTPHLIDQLDTLGLNGPRYSALWRLCLVALSIGSLILLILFVRVHYPALYDDTRKMTLLAFIVVSGVVAIRFLGFALGLKLNPSQYGFFTLMWVAAVGMLIAVMIRWEVAVLVTALLGLHTAILLDSQIQYGIAALFSALAGILCVRRIRQRSDILRAMLVLSGVNLLSVWALTIWNAGPALSQLKPDLRVATVWAVVAGIMAPVIFFVGVMVLERLFSVTTDLTLLELCDNHQPLLRRLVLEAPGTYAHSVGVASLAEAAAEVIGAETLWVRAGALYHDVGKICRPYFFIENQQGENLHNKLSPTMSAKVITAHISDGAELARQYHIPTLVLDFIRQHHGTSLVTYFYHQAIISSDTPSGISESSFRYPGPKPQTREAGILMLADTVESVIRSAMRRNPGRIDAIVARAIQSRLADGQLSECHLTLREIDQIQTAFTRVLAALHHHRIEYPAMERPEEKWLTSASSDR